MIEVTDPELSDWKLILSDKGYGSRVVDCMGDDLAFELTANQAKIISIAPRMYELLLKFEVSEYNPFEPDNQSEKYNDLKALLAEVQPLWPSR